MREMMRVYHEHQTKIATAWLARGSVQTGITETLNRSVPIPKGLVHYEDPEDLEADAMEIADEQHARASAFIEGVEPMPLENVERSVRYLSRTYLSRIQNL